jgi:hypothetical protein
MFIAGLLSSMNVFVDSYDHVRLTLNDIYMSLLMTSWMLVFMGHWVYGSIGVIVCLIAIRNQWFVTEREYLRGMIPHHSMAIFMSKKVRENEKQEMSYDDKIESLTNSIIVSQTDEIEVMKKLLMMT